MGNIRSTESPPRRSPLARKDTERIIKYIIYDILLHLCLVVLIPYFFIRTLVSGKYRGSLFERLGFLGRTGLRLKKAKGRSIWFHSVSVGETRAVMPLLKRFKVAHPETRLIVSTVTATGREVALKEGALILDAVLYLPLDLSWVVRRVLAVVRPSLFVIVEKEYWPNLIRLVSNAGAPVAVINATISDRSFERYKRLSFFFRAVFNDISLFCARREQDALKAVELGIEKERVEVLGNLKFDMEEVAVDPRVLKTALALSAHDRVIVAGSTHKGEEETILAVYRRLIEDFTDLKLLIAPRHPERFEEVAQLIESSGLGLSRRSAPCEARVILLDSVGELFSAYALSSVSFVGGSLAKVGGHNLLEPAFHRSPVLYGPHVETCAEMAEALESAGGAIMVKDQEALYKAFKKLLGDEDLRTSMGVKAACALDTNRGVTERTIKKLEGLL